MPRAIEIELKFQVPAQQVARLADAMARGSAPDGAGRRTLVAAYMDSADRRLASAGIAWRLRREGRRWVQALKHGGANALERFEHEVVRPGPSPDATVHAGTVIGDELLAILEQARADGTELGVRFRTEVRRTTRRIRTRGTVVDLAFDQGRILAGEQVARVRELEFELVSGDVGAMLALASRWCTRFGLAYDPRSKAERGDALADGRPLAPVRKARRPGYPVDATPTEALGAVLDECLAQVSHNLVGLLDGDAGNRTDHVHQARVGIRRLRSALRCFAGWTPAAPAGLVDDLRALFTTLGESRDRDVHDTGVAAELLAAGAPRLVAPAVAPAPDPVAAVRAPRVQRLLLDWIAWRSALDTHTDRDTDSDTDSEIDSEIESNTEPELRDHAQRRLRRWHRRIVADWQRFDELDEAALHALRKRIKRQRYAVEFFAPLLRRSSVDRYLGRLAPIQDCMGRLNDLFVARSRYEAWLADEPRAWFALGWLAAQVDTVRQAAGTELGRLAKADPPRARSAGARR